MREYLRLAIVLNNFKCRTQENENLSEKTFNSPEEMRIDETKK